MARKTMTREITTTTIKSAVMELVDGEPVARGLEDETVVGNLTVKQAEKEIKALYPDMNAQVIEVIPETHKYTMPVKKFMELSDLVEYNKQ